VIVRVQGLAVGYGGDPVLTDVTFEASAGERIAVLGPNSGGKTTLFRALLGELPPVAGEIEAPPRIASVPQTERSRLDYPVSALDVATLGALARLPWWKRPGRADRRRALAALSAVGLEPQAEASFGALSGGQRQRVLIARALVQDSELLVLDEPFAGLDATSAGILTALIERLTAEGRTTLVATHDLAYARACDRVLCLNGRQIAFGSPAATLSRGVLEATYGEAIFELPAERGKAAAGVLPPHHHHHEP
jgi:ABC-type Mn2+/Zn2+ transport system ATPase subunit